MEEMAKREKDRGISEQENKEEVIGNDMEEVLGPKINDNFAISNLLVFIF